MKQHALGRIDPEPGEQFRVTQRQFDHLAQLLDGIAHPADVVIVDLAAPGAGFLELLAQLNLGVLVDVDYALGHCCHNRQADLCQRIGRRVEHPRHFGRHIADLLLAGGGDQIAGDKRPSGEIALERLRGALQPHLALGGSEDHAAGGARFGAADLNVVARAHLGIGALQPVEADHFQPLVLWIGQHHPRRGGALALDRDHIALGHAELGECGPWQPGKGIAALLLPRRRDLEFDRLAFNQCRVCHC